MKLRLEDRKVTIYPILLKKIGQGSQGKIYKYHNKALKVIRYEASDLTLEDYNHLQNIKTKRILLPEDAFTGISGNLRCYTIELIKKNRKNQIYKMLMNQFVEEVYQIERELDLLSNNHVVIQDLILKNFMFDGIFRFVDAGRYKINYSYSVSEIRNMNQNVFNCFILGELFTKKIYRDYDLGIVKHPMLEYLEMEYRESSCKTMGEYIEGTMDKNESVLQYIKKNKV